MAVRRKKHRHSSVSSTSSSDSRVDLRRTLEGINRRLEIIEEWERRRYFTIIERRRGSMGTGPSTTISDWDRTVTINTQGEELHEEITEFWPSLMSKGLDEESKANVM
ncbi:hypothetical protein ABEB36_014915 [Hypothenemus hampei]|uniref:Uncharacterized protein n=1 Tax=Hypothenemus hampei TaxID=57062 RepID=A0ABD1E1J3_HYPHA